MTADQLTVVIPAYKMAKLLPKAIETVQGQQDAPRIIVVVDGADAETEGVARAYSGVRVLVNECRMGAPASRNAGLAAVETDYVAFLDADDYVEGDLHKGMTEALTAADMAISSYAREQPDGRRMTQTTEKVEPFLKEPRMLAARWLKGDIFGTGALGWQTGFLRSIGGWDDTLRQAQDIDMGLRGILGTNRIAVNKTGQAVYTNHDILTRISRTRMSTVMDDHHRIISRALESARNKPYEQDIRQAAGHRYYRLAGRCFFEGASQKGRWALSEARALGFHGHHGTWLHRLACFILGLETKQKLSRALAAMKGRLGVTGAKTGQAPADTP